MITTSQPSSARVEIEENGTLRASIPGASTQARRAATTTHARLLDALTIRHAFKGQDPGGEMRRSGS